MKFVHIADVHFDMPFTILNKNGFSEERRLDQRKAFKKVIEYIKNNNIEYLFVAGDLYENEYAREATVDYINNCFKEIPNTMVFITPGNHDPYINNSYYKNFNWNENVYIFDGEGKKQIKNINIYGYGFTDFYSKEMVIPNELDKTKINILITHADLNGTTKEYGEYNAILESKLKNSSFDYIALGHIHRNNFEKFKNIIYPGSLISLGFDEIGSHGMIIGEINEETKELKIDFKVLDNKIYIEEKIDISNLKSIEEIIEKINKIEVDENEFEKIVLIGKRNCEIQVNEILKHIENKQIIKIKDESKIEFNLEEIAKEQTLKGIFVRKLLAEVNENNKEEILESIYIGLELL